jgi:hypothetical protein
MKWTRLFATTAVTRKPLSAIFELVYRMNWMESELEDTGAVETAIPGSAGSAARARGFHAYYLAKQVEKIAAAGKRGTISRVHEHHGVGETRQEIGRIQLLVGDSLRRVLEIWHRAAPSIDLFCPDVYQQHRSSFLRTWRSARQTLECADDSESGIFGQAPAMNLLLAAVRFSAIGIAGFGAESALAPDGRLTDESKPVALHLPGAGNDGADPAPHRFSPRLFAVVQEEGQSYTYVQRAKYHLTIHFTSSPGRDHPGARERAAVSGFDMSDPENQRQRGRSAAASSCLRRMTTSTFSAESEPGDVPAAGGSPGPIPVGYLSRTAGNLAVFTIEEGHFDDSGAWVCEYTLRGDELYNGVYARPGVVLRARLNPRAGEVVGG